MIMASKIKKTCILLALDIFNIFVLLLNFKQNKNKIVIKAEWPNSELLACFEIKMNKTS